MAKLSEAQIAEQKVLRALAAAEGDDDTFYFQSFRPIAQYSRLPIPKVRRACRSLKRKGHAEFKSGLMTEDGDMYGAGYGITPAGRQALSEGNSK